MNNHATVGRDRDVLHDVAPLESRLCAGDEEEQSDERRTGPGALGERWGAHADSVGRGATGGHPRCPPH
ncbi:MAG: hypothetical protein O3A02_05935, partial [bacterium]|nr:hypothetical protein [bacterium]